MRRAKTIAAAVGATAVVGLMMSVVGSAHAGTNGQQVRVCINGADADYLEVWLTGTNQHDDLTLAVGAVDEDGCTSVAGYWWKGDVEVYVTKSESRTFSNVARMCAIPSQQKSDWFDCPIDALEAEPDPEPSPSPTP